MFKDSERLRIDTQTEKEDTLSCKNHKAQKKTNQECVFPKRAKDNASENQK